MKTVENTENNELIAEFMELSAIRHKYKPNVYEWLDLISGESILSTPQQMKFDQSWDWLMPVVDKIDQFGATIIIGRMFCDIKYQDPLMNENSFDVRISSGVKINAVNGAVVEFIKWYNNGRVYGKCD